MNLLYHKSCASLHVAAAAYASRVLPFEVMLLAMLLEEHKRVLHLQTEIEWRENRSASA